MRLVLAYGSGGGYYPFTQKPVDYQPYRPVYLFRGPPPDAGFSYGLFEDEEVQKKWYGELGLEPISPFSGKPANLLEELDYNQLSRTLGDDLNKNNLEEVHCLYCDAKYMQNLRHDNKGRELWCHRCGSKLPMIEHPHTPEPQAQEADASDDGLMKTFGTDAMLTNFIENAMRVITKSPEVKELIEKLALKYNIKPDQAKKLALLSLSNALKK